MKFKIITILIATIFIGQTASSQGIVNNGATIVVTANTHITIDNGGFINQTNSSDGEVDLDGVISLTGDFTNDATSGNVFINSGNDGEVIFNGTGTQKINGTGKFIDFEKVTVNSGSETEIVAGYAATTNGELTVDGLFTLKTPTDATPAGSLITNSTIGGTGDVNLERYFTVASRWQYISVPIAGQLSTPLIDTPYPGYVNPNFYTYDETWDNPTDPTSSDYSNWDTFTGIWQNVPTATTLNVGQGYIWNAYNASDLNITFSSTTPSDINTGDYSTTVTYTDNDDNGTYGEYYDGWNNVGNPFPSAISWDNITKTSSMDNTIYYWDGANGNYIYHIDGTDDHLSGTGQTINGTGANTNIPAYQSFFIHLDGTQASETFTINNNTRLHSTQAMHKANEDENEINFEYIKLRTENGNLSDETIIRFIDNTVTTFNGKEDALKMFPWNQDIPMIYSITENPDFPLAINTLPLSSIGTKIALGFKTGSAGNYEISVAELNIDLGTEVFLYDALLNRKVNLQENDSYSFYFNGNDSRDRFYLWFSPEENSEINNLDDFSQVNIWSGHDKVFIKISDLNNTSSRVLIMNSLGQVLVNKNINSTISEIPVKAAEGVYFVKLITKDNKIHTQKVFIKH